MKTYALLIPLFFCLLGTAEAQDKVREKDIIGNWKLVINIDDALEEAEDELDDEDNLLGEMILGSVSGFVTNILDEIDIYMEFRKDRELRVVVDAFGEREIEYSEWWIDHKGRLRISSDNEHFSSDENEYWMLKDGLLISYEDRDEPNKYVYMVNID